jgi:hypothetical protein
MRTKRLLLLCAALAIAAAVVPWAAVAATSGHSMYTARGPLKSGVDQTGTLIASGQSDYYFFWASAPGTATLTFTPAAGADQWVSVSRYLAGCYEFAESSDDWGAASTEIDVQQGLYLALVSGETSSAPYTFTVQGSTITTSQPTYGTRPKGLVRVSSKQGRTLSSAVPVKVNYDYTGTLGKRDTDYFRFKVTAKSTVWIGSPDMGAIVVGELVNSKGKKIVGLGPLDLHKLTLAKGTYYVKWHQARGFTNVAGGVYRFGVAGAKVLPK